MGSTPTRSSAPLLRLADVGKRYESIDSAPPITVLDGVSLELGSGETLSIVGPSGSGKSTLLHIIGTLDRPTSGQVVLDGQDLSGLNEKDTASVRSRKLG